MTSPDTWLFRVIETPGVCWTDKRSFWVSGTAPDHVPSSLPSTDTSCVVRHRDHFSVWGNEGGFSSQFPSLPSLPATPGLDDPRRSVTWGVAG